jgi:hypothetical protein
MERHEISNRIRHLLKNLFIRREGEPREMTTEELLRQMRIGAESLSLRINELNQSLRQGIDVDKDLTRATLKHSKRMTYLTIALVFATLLLGGVAAYQAILLKGYTSATHELGVTAGEQLLQSRLDSALVNRPYVEIHPAEFVVTDEKDPADETSVFCHLTLELRNYSNSIPAAKVTLEDFKLGSQSRGYLTPENYPIGLKDLAIFPGSVFKTQIGFVVNPDVHIKKYDKGEEDYEIYLKVTYTTVKDVEDKPRHWYRCNWIYSRGQLSVVDSETDLV